MSHDSMKPKSSSGRSRSNEQDADLLESLRSHAEPHFQRIAVELTAVLTGAALGTEDTKLVALSDVRQRLELKDAMTEWLDALCRPEQAPRFDFHRISALSSNMMCGLLLVQHELALIADEAMDSLASDVRAAVMRALAREAEMISARMQNEAPLITPPVTPPAPESAAPLQPARVRALAHDIRNPLNGAMLHATFLEREFEDLGASADLMEALVTVKAEIRRVAELVDEFVDVPLPAARSRAKIPVSLLCSRAIELVARDAAAAGIEVGADIAAEFGASDVVLEVDMSEMLEVLSQLLQQAVEAALAGGGKVLLRAHRESDSVIIEVRHDRRALSTPVPLWGALTSSARNSDPTASNNVSSNLSVAVKVVAEHGGTIEVDSEPGRTEFRVSLPIGAVTQRAAEQLS